MRGPVRLAGETEGANVDDLILSIELAHGTRVEVDRGGGIVITPSDRLGHSFLLTDRSEELPELVSCINTSRETAVLAARRGDWFQTVRARRGLTHRSTLGERIKNAEQLSIHELDDGFVILFENGLLCISETGQEIWRIERTTFDWRFVGARDGAIWVADVHENLLGFDHKTGHERS